ncbi:MAG: DinB family protein [Acidimicrobiia bacterium]|nr:DinB family protein [Acidimicrobiia bacterium]
MYLDLIARAFRRNDRIVAAHAEGLTDTDALRQSGFNTNCLNWVLGHIVAGRDEILSVLGQPVVAGDRVARYHRESDPIREDGPGVIPMTELLVLLNQQSDRIVAALDGADDAFMEVEVAAGEGRAVSRAGQVLFFYFHETYHVGQTDVIRQLSGKSDKII